MYLVSGGESLQAIDYYVPLFTTDTHGHTQFRVQKFQTRNFLSKKIQIITFL